MSGEEGGLLYSVGNGDSTPIVYDCEIDLPAGDTIRFDLASGGPWYGHGFNHDQPYPLEKGSISNDSFAVNNIQSPIWMCRSGYAILVETNSVLSVHLNDGESGRLAISCPAENVKVRAFGGRHLPEAQQKLMSYVGWPGPTPDKSFLGDPVFCTWTQYPRCITQKRVLSMAREIRDHDCPCTTMTIDDKWESAYGDHTFSKDFPDPAGMIRDLHEMGFSVLLWITPYVNEDCASFENLAAKGFLVRDADGEGPALMRWWGGTAGVIDLTNPEAREWYKSGLLRLKEQVGVDGFKIDGGDAKYQPAHEESRWHAPRGPSGYADALLALFEEIAPGLSETRTAWLSQHRHIIWRQGGKDSHWGPDNGLAAMVSLGLHMALMGYDIFMPDMIPGRVQTMKSDAPLPTDELFVRWTETSAFMPIMQFSYLPWNYADDTARAVLAYAKLHKALAGYIHDQAAGRSAPLVRPLWFDDPQKEELYGIADEFMLGYDVLVAPVLTEGAETRDIVLPHGEWRDGWTGETHPEGVLSGHPAPCPGVPVFVRSSNRELFDDVHRHLEDVRRGTVPSGKTTATYSAGVDRDLGVSG